MNNKIEIIIYYFKKQCKQLKITLIDQWRIFKSSEKLVKNYIINTIYVNMLTVKIRWKCYVKDQKLYTEICCSAIKKFITKKKRYLKHLVELDKTAKNSNIQFFVLWLYEYLVIFLKRLNPLLGIVLFVWVCDSVNLFVILFVILWSR